MQIYSSEYWYRDTSSQLLCVFTVGRVFLNFFKLQQKTAENQGTGFCASLTPLSLSRIDQDLYWSNFSVDLKLSVCIKQNTN